jgi:hypothetical protein
LALVEDVVDDVDDDDTDCLLNDPVDDFWCWPTEDDLWRLESLRRISLVFEVDLLVCSMRSRLTEYEFPLKEYDVLDSFLEYALSRMLEISVENGAQSPVSLQNSHEADVVVLREELEDERDWVGCADPFR